MNERLMPVHSWAYPARLVRARDGDTHEYELLLRPHPGKQVIVGCVLRHFLINTAEHRKETMEEWRAATDDGLKWHAEAAVAEGGGVVGWPLLVSSAISDKYGRDLGYAWRCFDGLLFAQRMIDLGHSLEIPETLQLKAAVAGGDVGEVRPFGSGAS